MSYKGLMLLGVLATFSATAQNLEQPKRIPVSVRVEPEGPTGLWTQSARDLPEGQRRELEKLITSLLSKDESLTIVDANSKSNLHVTVVAAQVAGASGRRWVIASSAVTLANEANSLGTHDVIAGPDLQSVARSIVSYFASFRLRVVFNAFK